MPKLSSEEISQELKSMKGWSIHRGKLHKEYEFEDFESAMAFISRIAPLAAKMDHHPDIFNSYNKVVIDLVTHEESGVTEKDFQLAKQIDRVEHVN
ncbi:MAG: 4a-hydroxytetrahydrobiopterin dehydratase [Thermoprotei archaeon]